MLRTEFLEYEAVPAGHSCGGAVPVHDINVFLTAPLLL